MKSLNIFLVIMIIFSAHADDELNRLRVSHNAAVNRTIAPLRSVYEKDLQKLLQRYTQAGKLDAASEVVQELQLLKSNMVASVSLPPPKVYSDSCFVGQTWITPTGTRFTFDENLTGKQQYGNQKTTPFKWEKTGNGVEVKLVDEKGCERHWIFRFAGRTEAYYKGVDDVSEIKLKKQQ